MTKSEILCRVDHTLLKPEATWAQVHQLCDEALEYKTASVCINPCHIKNAAGHLAGRIPVCTVIGFPLGATSTRAKVYEARQAMEDGAAELDMVINIGALKAGAYDEVQADIEAVRAATAGKLLKVIIETCLLTDAEKAKMCTVVYEAGADYIKTSTGFSTGGATFADIELFAKCLSGKNCKIKASGGIRSVEDMEKYIQLGASRLGTSSAIKLLNA